MAEIATTTAPATVVTSGKALDATVNLSGALMEMLSTIYAYILMAAIREAIQNACDASKRAGLKFADVVVTLPTASNPMLMVTDRGAGMSKAFMEDPAAGYLAFGASTKAGDNGAAGGLGVGRWAAYGYIRECYITTCHESDMVERTYFQYQGEGAKPKVSPAAEAPGLATGTRIYFPVKETDLDEAYRAVSWLKAVMQLTMGDSFSVDKPALLPQVIPPFDSIRLDLESFDPSLAGVSVFPMSSANLQYGRHEMVAGSLVVLTNREAGVGGLPFHVKSPSGKYSVFSQGMIIEVPMSAGVPFMPSREELKYTDEVDHLLRRIDDAAGKALLAKATELYEESSLSSKAKLTQLLGSIASLHLAHWAARDGACPLNKEMSAITNGNWNGKMNVPLPRSVMMTAGLQLRYREPDDSTVRQAQSYGGMLSYSAGADKLTVVAFNPCNPITLVVNDLKSGGLARFRNWAANEGKFLFFSAEDAATAREAADAVNATFGGELPLVTTSSLPATARSVVGSKVVSRLTTKGSVTYHSFQSNKQETECISFTTFDARNPKRVWIGKDGGKLTGLKSDYFLSMLLANTGGIDDVLKHLGYHRLYLLNPKQAGELLTAQASLAADGLEDLTEEDMVGCSDDELAAFRDAKTLSAWVSIEEVIKDFTQSTEVQEVLKGIRPTRTTTQYELTTLCDVLAKSPRMVLTGTAFDRDIAPHLDLMSGTVHLVRNVPGAVSRIYAGLQEYGRAMDIQPGDSDERKELAGLLCKLHDIGHRNYPKVYETLLTKYPILGCLGNLQNCSEKALDAMATSLALLYR